MSLADRIAAVHHTEQVWWTAAVDAGLPPGALAGAGDFAAALPAEVAPSHPREPDALLLAVHLLTRPTPRACTAATSVTTPAPCFRPPRLCPPPTARPGPRSYAEPWSKLAR
ncbi:hypothetical protein [Streptomyces parvulus]